jgi:hypothetical protein
VGWDTRKGQVIGIKKEVEYLIESEGKHYWVPGKDLQLIRKPSFFDIIDEELQHLIESFCTPVKYKM